MPYTSIRLDDTAESLPTPVVGARVEVLIQYRNHKSRYYYSVWSHGEVTGVSPDEETASVMPDDGDEIIDGNAFENLRQGVPRDETFDETTNPNGLQPGM